MDVATSVVQSQPAVTLVASPGAKSAANEQVCISVYAQEMPAFVEGQLLILYGSVFSSLMHIKAQGRLQTANTYVARRDGKYIAILLFEIDKGVVQVINEVVKIDLEEISRFAEFIFSTYSTVRVLSFKAIRTDGERFASPLPYFCQRYNYLEDIVVSLPETIEEYSKNIDKKALRNIKRYMGKLERDYPTFSFRIVSNEALSETNLREIIALNQARMQAKGKVSNHDEISILRIRDLVNAHGLTGLASIDGKVCAGAICYQMGDNFFLSVLAHDPAYDHCSIGIISCYRMICECIERGGVEFHFLWGEHRYKSMLLGVPRELNNLVVYRSPVAVLRHADVAITHAMRDRTRQFKRWLQVAEREKRLLGKVILSVSRFFRRGLRFIKEGVWGD